MEEGGMEIGGMGKKEVVKVFSISPVSFSP
jgi:hypothetical protein